MSAQGAVSPTAQRQRYTSLVRRGLAQLLDMDLAQCVETHIARKSGPGLTRAQRLAAPKVKELRAALAWITQEAER